MILGAQRPPVDPHALARQILSAPRFRMHVAAAPRKTWWDFFVGWIGDRFKDLVDALTRHVRVGESTSVALGDIILVAVCAVVVIVAVRLIASYAGEAVAAAPSHALSPRVRAEALYQQSLVAADAGRYGEAIALLFRAALVALDVRGIVHDEPSLTVNEYRREVHSRAPRFIVPFDALARIFTAAIYAEAPVSAAQWNAARDAYVQLSEGAADAA